MWIYAQSHSKGQATGRSPDRSGDRGWPGTNLAIALVVVISTGSWLSSAQAGSLSPAPDPPTLPISGPLEIVAPTDTAPEEAPSPPPPSPSMVQLVEVPTEFPAIRGHYPHSVTARYGDLFLALTADQQGEVEAAELYEDPHGISRTFPVVRDRRVERHIQYFHTTIKDRFGEWLIRLGRYQPMVERVFAEFGLPPDLIYLSLVESGFNPRAYSRARATGPWQFMKGTARLYGLRINYYVDERRDPIKSTVAAARHLRDLYDTFGDWPLAIAAYNAGEGRVKRALKRTKGESFSDIARTRYIRRETREYVPRIMAATIIARDPEEYGFSASIPNPHEFEEVIVKRPLHLRDLARAAGIPYGELRSLNPELRRYITPPGDKHYHLKVPVGMSERVAGLLDKIPSWNRSTPPRMKGTKVPKGWYRVRIGDSLWKIAKRFRISVRELKARNNLRGWLIRPGDLLAIR